MKDHLKRRYKNYTDEQIIEVLENQSNYQDIAIQVAKEEANFRNISLDNLKDSDRQLLKRDVSLMNSIISENWNYKIQNISFRKVSSLYSEGNGFDRAIILIILIFILAIMSEVFNIFSSLSSIKYFEQFSIYDGAVFSLIEISFIVFMIFLIWNRKGIGWCITSIYSTFIFMINLSLFVESCKYFYSKKDNLPYQDNLNINDDNGSDLLDLLELFAPNPPIYYIPSLIIICILLCLLFKKETVTGFGLTGRDVLKVGSVGVILFLLFEIFINL